MEVHRKLRHANPTGRKSKKDLPVSASCLRTGWSHSEDSPLRLEHFFYEPFYQLPRQQMFAFQMEKAKEHGSDRVRVLHIAPAGNVALRRVTAPALKCFGDDAFEVFRFLLVRPKDFISRSIDDLFKPLLSGAGAADDWVTYIIRRYLFLF